MTQTRPYVYPALPGHHHHRHNRTLLSTPTTQTPHDTPGAVDLATLGCPALRRAQIETTHAAEIEALYA
jgi:hypothetical protein